MQLSLQDKELVKHYLAYMNGAASLEKLEEFWQQLEQLLNEDEEGADLIEIQRITSSGQTCGRLQVTPLKGWNWKAGIKIYCFSPDFKRIQRLESE